MQEILNTLRKLISAGQVFGEPVERANVTVLPAARIIGGGGGGGNEGEGTGERPAGSGLGFGLIARPAGAFVIRDDGAEWHPANDRAAYAVAGAIVAFGVLLVLRAAVRSR